MALKEAVDERVEARAEDHVTGDRVLAVEEIFDESVLADLLVPRQSRQTKVETASALPVASCSVDESVVKGRGLGLKG